MMAYANGEEIELCNRAYDSWMKCETSCFNWGVFDYRIKPKSKPRFDPETLQPFDRVLARFDEVWHCDFYSSPNHGKRVRIGKHVCVGCQPDEVIPYNDETKHLVGTTDEAPEYYRYWED